MNPESNFMGNRAYVSVLSNQQLREILLNHEAAMKANDRSNAFTVFEIISNLYYREDFHSDIIAFLLNPKQNHGYGTLGIKLFIDLIENCIDHIENEKPDCNVVYDNYRNAGVIREYAVIENGRIDILIKDDISKHAIIIENKINNAPDMPRQIPRYCNSLESLKYTIDAVIYLPLTRFKSPEMTSWEEVDREKWKKKIVTIPAISDKDDISLVSGWLNLFPKDINPDVASTIRQYNYLISKLNNQEMDKQSYKELYDYLMMVSDDQLNLDRAFTFMKMMNSLPQYLALRLFDKYEKRCSPFQNVFIYDKTMVVYDNCRINGCAFHLDVLCDFYSHDNNYYIRIGKRGEWELPEGINNIVTFLKGKGVRATNGFTVEDNYTCSCLLPLKESIENIIDDLLGQLKSINNPSKESIS